VNIIGYFNEGVKKFSVFDVKLAQIAAMCLILVAAKLVPEIMNVHIGWFIALLILSALKPCYVMFLKR